jgi:hypothetical protein
VALYQTLLRSPLLLNLFECFYHCFVLVGEQVKHSQIRLFADDSIIYRPIKTQSDCIKLQEDLESAVKWEQDWLMAFHPDKCNILRVTTNKSPPHFIIFWVVQEIGMLYLLQILH